MSNDNNDVLNSGVADTDIKHDSNMLNNGTADTDIKSDSNILNGKQVTEVTSVAMEEEKTGQTINVGSPDELYAKAMQSYIGNMQALSALISRRQGNGYALGRKAMNRVLTAILQLPQDGLPVNLVDDDEKAAFAIGQRIVSDRFLITYKHIVDEQKKLKEKKEGAKNG